MSASDTWLEEIEMRFRVDKEMVERAVAQLTDEEFRQRPADGVNSVAVIVQHIAGNLKSRWTDFLTTDGEKPDRNRETEFAAFTGPRQQLMQAWNRGFDALFKTLGSLRPEDMGKTVYIRTEPHSVQRAIVRSLDHLAYHVGQILLISRMVHAGPWNYLTVAPGSSAEFNRQKAASR